MKRRAVVKLASAYATDRSVVHAAADAPRPAAAANRADVFRNVLRVAFEVRFVEVSTRAVAVVVEEPSGSLFEVEQRALDR
jgi:hypothetical protein